MAVIKHKNSNIQNKIPLLDDVADGQIGINTHDGRVFQKKSSSTLVPGKAVVDDIIYVCCDNTAGASQWEDITGSKLDGGLF